MASITEANGSREFKYDGVSSTYQRIYNLRGYGSESAALVDLLAVPATATVNGVELASRSLSLKPRGRASSGNFLGVADYRHVSRTPARDAPENLNDEKLSFSFSMPNAFFTKAISQDKFGTDSKDVGLAINVLEDGTVEGMEIPIPGDGFQISTRLDIGGADPAVVNAWIKARIDQLGTYNDATFRSLESGDALFRAFSGDERADGDFDITWDFAAVINEDYTATNFETGLVDFAIGRKIKGFELVWVQYAPFEDTVNNVIVPKARGVYVAEVFESSDFSLFGIAT